MQLKSLEELFGMADDVQGGDPAFQILQLNPAEMKDFADHPFLVKMDEDMAELVESIRKNGVLHPGIARPIGSGGYEIIAGHRRKQACLLAGLTQMPFYVRDYSDDEAVIIMVESNIQRTSVSIKEKAFAYKMHMEAEKRMHCGKGLRSDAALAQKVGESRNTIQRYIRLTKLVPALLDLTDVGKIPVITASDLSYLTEEEQDRLYTYMAENGAIPSGKQAQTLKEYSKRSPGCITQQLLHTVLGGKETEKARQRVVIKGTVLSQYFPEAYGPKEMEDVIIGLLQKWQRENGARSIPQVDGQVNITEWDDGKYMPEGDGVPR